MKAIEMNQALMEAIKTTEVLGASALEETRALRQLVASANARIEELETAAVEDAKVCAIEQNGEEKGKFLFDGHHFELRRAETFDFIGKPQKYTMAEGVAFRQKTAEQTVLKAKSAAITKALKAIKDAFPETHPNIEPDSVDDYFVARDKGVPAHEAREVVATKHGIKPKGVRHALDWFFHEAKKRRKYDFLQKFSHEVEH